MDVDHELAGTRMNWPAIWAGFISATVVQIALSVLGLAIGFSIWTPSNGGIGEIAMGAWIWSVCTAIVSLFVGGIVLGRFSRMASRTDVLLNSVVMWGLAAMLAVWMGANSVGMLVGSTVNVVTRTAGSVVSAAGSAAGSVASGLASRPNAAGAIADSVARITDSTNAIQKLPSGEKIREVGGEVANAAATGTAIAAWIAFGTIVLSVGGAMWGAEISIRRAAHGQPEKTSYPSA